MLYPIIGKSHLVRAFEEVMEIAEETGVRTQFSHLIFVGMKSWKQADRILALIDKANKEGRDFGFDMYSYNFGASVITVILPAWYLALWKEKRKTRWVKFKTKTLISIARLLVGLDFCDFTIAYVSDELRSYEGRTVSEVAKELKISNIDAYLYLIEVSNGQARLIINRYYNDGMTGHTASRFGIPERGLLLEGNYADLTVFSEDEICVTDPLGFPNGIRYVYANGQEISEERQCLHGKLILKR